MPRFKDHDYSQTKLLPMSFDRQNRPGTFDHSLTCLIERELDLRFFDHSFAD